MRRKLAIAAIALVAPAALSLPAGTAAPVTTDARDTSWGCPGCVVSHR